MTLPRWRLAALALLVALSLAAGLAQAQPAGRPDKVVVAHVPLMTFAILYSAIDNGFMAEQGIQVDLQRVASGTQAVGFLAQGQVDVGAIGLAGGIFNAFNRGFDMRIVATASVWGPKHDVMILGQADKVKSGELKTIADLRGKRVGIAGGTGSAGAYLVDAALRTVGLTIRDVQVVSIANADVPVALKNKALDAGLAGVPFATQAVTEGWAVPLLQNFEPGAATTVFLYSGKLIKERPAVAERFTLALLQGARAMQGAQLTSEKNLAIWTKYTGVRAETIKSSTPLVYSPDLEIFRDNIARQEKSHREAGFTDYQTPVPVEQMLDESFRQKALARLGPYRP
ncbi:MAG: hypothetical protein A3K12_04615 [Candidatus Rokubacteria bacterium RIFCSPLOWO2_12_FULL_71_19]|nr:MAG: hypothetical protein A3K12_04615 [Candidatus Rokubacteria bacterium RIFCSPLOWO2_12_FULL_71_19]